MKDITHFINETSSLENAVAKIMNLIKNEYLQGHSKPDGDGIENVMALYNEIINQTCDMMDRYTHTSGDSERFCDAICHYAKD